MTKRTVRAAADAQAAAEAAQDTAGLRRGEP